MCRLFESIKVENRHFYNLHYHQLRINRSLPLLYGGEAKIALEEELEIPENLGDGLYKCRVEYDTRIRKVEFLPYIPKPIRTLKLVRAGSLEYSLKFTDRNAIAMYFEKRGRCDDVLFVKHGLITDTSYCNIVFYDGEKWITPKRPLLKGTKRQQLLDAGKLIAEDVHVNHLQHYQTFRLINAMLDFEEGGAQPVSNVFC